ncbi:glycosyltransferase [Oculatella sp. LEGE 06141]|uniref:glycosyltransferase n=1 Tax=Oculatella sp. LEGE 06141 TaxID=1828648 RepID=UPI0018815899|nr:glycosyltransferase [Oculatella sp. LEGE 06141]MBE9181110.1 glycosyltransferase [Oculatella sp. LEGE 06141]
MTKHYLFFTRHVLPQSAAFSVQVAHSANAAANLGYSAVLLHLQEKTRFNPVAFAQPFQPRSPDPAFAKFYNLQDKLKVAQLPRPYPVDRWYGKWTAVSTLISRYYFPFHILPHTQLVHSRDWNFVKTAVQQGVPAIYEHHHHENKRFESDIVRNPLFQLAVTVADNVRDSMIANGMPPDKVIWLHNGFNQHFLLKQPDRANTVRQQLLSGRQFLVVYSGGLHRFKGVDLLIDVAQALPQVQFVLAGGNATQVTEYQHLVRSKHLDNVILLGFLPQDELAVLLQAANVLAHPHCAGSEASFTSPLKLFDYMASATPIVATEIPTLMEFKPTGAIAGWCEPDHPQAFAQCLQQVLEHFPYQPEGYTAGSSFVQQFSWENRIAKILSKVEPSMQPEWLDRPTPIEMR